MIRPVGPDPPRQCRGMAPRADGAVHQDGSLPGRQPRDHLVEQDGAMHGPGRKLRARPWFRRSRLGRHGSFSRGEDSIGQKAEPGRA